MNNILIKLSEFFLFFLPVALITGPALSEIAINFISIIFLYNFFKNNELKLYFKNLIIIIIFIFYIICILSSFLSEELSYSIKTSITYFRFLLFAVASSWLIDCNPSILKKIFYSLIFCFSILIFFAFIEHYTGYNIIYGKQLRSDRLSSLFGNELILGSYLSRFFPLVIGFWLTNNFFKNYNKNYFGYFLMVLVPLTVFLSGERTSFFFILIGIFGFLIFFNINYKKKIFFISSIFVVISFFIIASDTVKKNTIDRTLKQIKPSNDKVYFFSDEHQALAISTIQIFKDNPIIGAGPKTFRKKCLQDKYVVKNKEKVFGCYTHPHNTYLQILAETGIIGFLFISILFFLLIINLLYLFLKKYFFNKNIYENLKIGCLLCFLISLFPVVPSGNFFNNYLNIMYYYPLGIYLGYNLIVKKSLNHEKNF